MNRIFKIILILVRKLSKCNKEIGTQQILIDKIVKA